MGCEHWRRYRFKINFEGKETRPDFTQFVFVITFHELRGYVHRLTNIIDHIRQQVPDGSFYTFTPTCFGFFRTVIKESNILE
jgi:hypothetical protein